MQGRAVGADKACIRGQLGVTRPAEEGSWGRPGLQGRVLGGGGQPGLQGKAVGGGQACKGGQLGANKLAKE